MTTVEYKNFIERVKIVLRNKRKRKEDTRCTMEEIFETLSQEEQSMYHYYKIPTFRQTLYESIKVVNPLI